MMKLEKIEATASRDRVKLCFDDGSTMRVPLSVISDLALFAPMELDEADINRLKEAAGAASAKLRAVRIIAQSGVSERELRRKLVQKGENEAHAEQAIEWLTELQLLDDREAARQVVQKGIQKGYGRARIRQMLYEKGIGKELWEEALRELPDPDDAIDRYLAAHLGHEKPDQRQTKKIADALMRRGYSWDQIRSGLSRHEVSIEED